MYRCNLLFLNLMPQWITGKNWRNRQSKFTVFKKCIRSNPFGEKWLFSAYLIQNLRESSSISLLCRIVIQSQYTFEGFNMPHSTKAKISKQNQKVLRTFRWFKGFTSLGEHFFTRAFVEKYKKRYLLLC